MVISQSIKVTGLTVTWLFELPSDMPAVRSRFDGLATKKNLEASARVRVALGDQSAADLAMLAVPLWAAELFLRGRPALRDTALLVELVPGAGGRARALESKSSESAVA